MGRPIDQVAQAYFEMGEHLSLNWFMQQVNALASVTHWEALARETMRDDLDWQQRALTVGILNGQLDDEPLEQTIGRWQSMLNELKATDTVGFPMVSVALRELLDLAQASRHTTLNTPNLMRSSHADKTQINSAKIKK